MKKNIIALPKQKLSRQEQQELKGGLVQAGYKYVCLEGYLCSNNLVFCNRICQLDSGQNCVPWNRPCP